MYCEIFNLNKNQSKPIYVQSVEQEQQQQQQCDKRGYLY